MSSESKVDWQACYLELQSCRQALERLALRIEITQPVKLSLDSVRDRERFVKIIKTVAAMYYGVAVEAIEGRIRTENLAWARQAAMALSIEFTGLSSIRIGELFDRDHGTVLHAIEHVGARCSINHTAQQEIEALRILVKETLAK